MKIHFPSSLGLITLFTYQQLVSASHDTKTSFSPSSYPQRVASCKAVNRAVNENIQVDINLRELNLYDYVGNGGIRWSRKCSTTYRLCRSKPWGGHDSNNGTWLAKLVEYMVSSDTRVQSKRFDSWIFICANRISSTTIILLHRICEDLDHQRIPMMLSLQVPWATWWEISFAFSSTPK